MPETTNIMRMAELASDQIFSVFGWEKIGPTNQNTECVDQEKHGKKRKVHPTDAVFRYLDPYLGYDIYVDCDLKSYAAGTLQTADLSAVIRDLGRAAECANKSQHWKTVYVDQTRSHDVLGMVFLYNHTNDYDKDFGAVLEDLPPSTFDLSPGGFVGVVGPDRVIYLNSIANDIKCLQADQRLPGKENRFFFFPHLKRNMSVHQQNGAVPLGTLLSPMIVLGYEFPAEAPAGVSRRGYYAYYDGRCDSVDEFEYILDYFFKYQLADEHSQITINAIAPDKLASAIFENAKKEYARDYWPVADTSRVEFEKVLKRVRFRSVQNVVARFSEVELGMSRD